jgi:putative addiction module component (TIGR02574 family)
MSMTLLEIKNEIRALPKEQKRELTDDLIEEISAENFPVSDAMLNEVNRRIEAHQQNPSKLSTLAEIEANIRSRKNRG